MKKIIFISILLLSKIAFAQTETTAVRQYKLSHTESATGSINDENRRKIVFICNEIKELKKDKVTLIEKSNHLQVEIEKAQTSIRSLKDTLVTYRKLIHSNTVLGKANTSDIKNNQSKLQTDISQANSAIKSGDAELNVNISNRTLAGIIAFLLSVILTIVSAILLYRRSRTDISKLKQQAEFLNEKIVEKLTTEVTEISKLTSVISSNSTATDHSLIKTLADRITFMEMTLYKMDGSIRGHKQLSKSIKQMKDNLLANGYELMDMLGKTYHEGLNATPTFVEDDNLEKGVQIITGIIKPQINYNGKMIQSAQITVSQN